MLCHSAAMIVSYTKNGLRLPVLLFITHPPQGIFVSNVTGHVLVVTEEAMQAKLQVHPSDPKGTTSGKDTLLSVLCLWTNKSHSSCSQDWFLYHHLKIMQGRHIWCH